MNFKFGWGVGLAGLLALCCTVVSAEDAKPEKPKTPTAAAKEKGEAKSKSTDKPDAKAAANSNRKTPADPFALPKGATPEKLIKFVNDLMEMEPILLSEEAIKAHYEQVAAAILLATAQVLDSEEIADSLAAQALDARFVALSLKSRLGDKNASQQRLNLAEKYSTDSRKVLAKMAQEQRLFVNLEKFDGLPPGEQEKMLDDAVAFIKSLPQLNDRSVKLILTIGRVIEGTSVEGLSARAYEQFSEAFVHSQDPAAANLATQFERMAKRMRLVGHPLEIEGQLTTKEPIDWASYRGKVVLIDFWATWCGPCVAELPNLKSIYQGFSSKGFDIVGISKDSNKDALDRFLAKNQIAWSNLFNFDEGAEDHSLAEKYGILSIPYTILVGKDGKVIKMNPTSAELKEMLTELLGPPAEAEKKSAEKADEKEEKTEEKKTEEK